VYEILYHLRFEDLNSSKLGLYMKYGFSEILNKLLVVPHIEQTWLPPKRAPGYVFTIVMYVPCSTCTSPFINQHLCTM